MTIVLVIEDDPDLRELVEHVLQTKGYEVDTAVNGLEGLARVARRMPDVILLDMKMPIMSGSEFAAAYHARYTEAESAPVVVMTAADHAARRSQEIGGTDFLSKPFSTTELIDVVRRHVKAATRSTSTSHRV